MIPFIWFRCKACFKDFPVIEYTYVACFKVSMSFVIALCGLIVFMVYWAETYSEPFLSFLWKQLPPMRKPCLDVGKGSEYANTGCKVDG